jgi:hypothetical protein
MGLISGCRYPAVNLKAKMYIYVNSTNLPPVSLTPVANLPPVSTTLVNWWQNLPPVSLIPVANLPPVSLIPAAKLPPVSLTPVANLPPVSLILVVNLELRISPRIVEKIRNGPNGILRGLGETDS